MAINPEDPHFLTQTDEWNTLSPHEKKDRMQAHIREELQKDMEEEEAARKRLLERNDPEALIAALEDSSNETKQILTDQTEEFWKQGDEKTGIQAVVAESQTTNSSEFLLPILSSSGLTAETLLAHREAQIKDQEECLELYEGVLRAIASITKVDSPLDRSAEAFFMVASKMRKMAIGALQKTGAWR